MQYHRTKGHQGTLFYNPTKFLPKRMIFFGDTWGPLKIFWGPNLKTDPTIVIRRIVMHIYN